MIVDPNSGYGLGFYAEKPVKELDAYLDLVTTTEGIRFVDCPDGWVAHTDHCYIFINETYGFTLDEATSACGGARGSALVSIHSEEENMFIVDQIDGDIWIHGHLFDNTWVWADGSTWDYENMIPQDNVEGYECLKMAASGEWIPSDCKGEQVGKQLVCKLKTVITVPDEQYLYLSPSTILHLPDFQQINCEQNFPGIDVYNALAGLVKVGEKNRLMVCGGYERTGCLLLTENGWEETYMEFMRFAAGSSRDGKGNWLVTGGTDPNSFLNTTVLFSPDGNWSAGPDLPTPVAGHCQVEAITSDGISTTAYVIVWDKTYVLEGDSWIELYMFPIENQPYVLYCGTMGGKIYVFEDSTTDIRIYDPTTNSWEFGPQLPTALVDAQVINHQDHLYVFVEEWPSYYVFTIGVGDAEWQILPGVTVQAEKSFSSSPVLPAEALFCV